MARAREGGAGGELEFVQFDASELASTGWLFDAVVCLGSTLNHTEDWEAMVRGISSVLRPGGISVLSVDSFFGLDSFFWLVKRDHSGYAREVRVRQFVDNVWCWLQSRRHHNDWTMEIPNHGRFTLPLTYESPARFGQMLEAAKLRVIDKKGANLLTCLLPRVLNASVELDRKPELGRFEQSVLRLDVHVADRLPLLSANLILVARKD